MTKKYTIAVVAVLAVVIGSIVVLGLVGTTGTASQEKEIAKIGNYPITESAFREYVFLASFNEDSVKSLESIAKDYAKAKIAAEEIAGTEYDVSSDQREVFLAQGYENAQRDLETNADFCEQYGITQEELTSAVVTSKMDITVMSKHLSWFFDKLEETDEQQGQEIEYAAGERLSLYEEYMEKKVAEMEFVILDAQRVDEVQTFLEHIVAETEE